MMTLQQLTVEKNDPRLCLAGTENLWTVCRKTHDEAWFSTEVIAENVGHADAVLFAAAPELLDALRELCADTYLADPINADRMSKARAAIAKAERGEA